MLVADTEEDLIAGTFDGFQSPETVISRSRNGVDHGSAVGGLDCREIPSEFRRIGMSATTHIGNLDSGAPGFFVHLGPHIIDGIVTLCHHSFCGFRSAGIVFVFNFGDHSYSIVNQFVTPRHI
ncbi:hypothetical protein IMSAGC006_02278 [Muribaculaceae bacterium]|nr:hypothetical protein IMSAGC006_02278 [Muribaculaceae bacterium]